jgi:hypothetical protein
MMKINNEDEWKEIKEGNYKGFSIEGMYKGFENLKMAEDKPMTDDEKLEKIIDILTNGK